MSPLDYGPKISIVTPSYNQGKYLEAAIQSVISQDYPNWEYVVMDGGSTDGSVDIIRKYEKHLKFWVSEKDAGPYAAVHKGFLKTTGEVMAWLNADDKYLPWTFQVVGRIFASSPEVEWLTTLYPLTWDATGKAVECAFLDGFSRKRFYRGEYLPGAGWPAQRFIQQESTFWRRSLWEKAGGRLETSLKLASDFELWARFYKFTELYGVNTPLGGFRAHKDQRTAHFLNDYIQEARKVLLDYGGKPPGRVRSFIRTSFDKKFLPLVRNVAIRSGLIHEDKRCIYCGPVDGWRITDP